MVSKKINNKRSDLGIFLALAGIILLAIISSVLVIGKIYNDSQSNENNYPSNLMTRFIDNTYTDYVYCPLTEGVDTDEDRVFDLCDN